MPSPHWIFGPFRLDPDNACLWQGAQAWPLTPKAFGVLYHLVTHPDRLVTKDELFETIWPDTAVSEAALRVCIGELRKMLGDEARAPRFIATMARRGYRFLAPVTRQDPIVGAVSDTVSPRFPATPVGPLVGREVVLSRLHTAWALARQGPSRMQAAEYHLPTDQGTNRCSGEARGHSVRDGPHDGVLPGDGGEEAVAPAGHGGDEPGSPRLIA